MRQGRKKWLIEAKILIDATELGNVRAAVGVPYDLGMDRRETSDEAFAPEEANHIVQDLTYVVTLKDYGPGSDRTIKNLQHKTHSKGIPGSRDIFGTRVIVLRQNGSYEAWLLLKPALAAFFSTIFR